MHMPFKFKEFVDTVLEENTMLFKTMTTVLSNAVPALCSSLLLRSQTNRDNELQKQIAQLIFMRFIRSPLVYAST